MRDDQKYAAQSEGCVGRAEPSPTTVENVLDGEIQHLAEKLHRLVVLKLSTPSVVLRQPARDIRELAQQL